MTAAAWLCLAFLLPTGSFAWDIARTPRDGAPKPRPKRMYEAPFRQPGPDLPHRPEGMQSLKAEIALTPPGRHRAAEPVSTVLIGRPPEEIDEAIAAGKVELRDAVPDWTQTDEHFFSWGAFFEIESAGAR